MDFMEEEIKVKTEPDTGQKYDRTTLVPTLESRQWTTGAANYTIKEIRGIPGTKDDVHVTNVISPNEEVKSESLLNETPIPIQEYENLLPTIENNLKQEWDDNVCHEDPLLTPENETNNSHDLNQNSMFVLEKKPKLETRDTIENYENVVDGDSAKESEQFPHAPTDVKERKELNLPNDNSESLWKCEICGKDFLNSPDLALHRKAHSEEYVCKECGMTFRKLFFLNTHMMWHSGKTYKCDMCRKHFSGQSSLAQHRLTHTVGEKPFKCDVCGVSLAEHTDLLSHKLSSSHTRENPHECDKCGISFTARSSLNRHKSIHRGEFKPHKCDLRGQGSIRLIHKSTHTKEKPIICETCGVRFLSEDYLTAHKCTYMGKNSIKCEGCGLRFLRRDHFTRHLLKHKEGKPCRNFTKTIMSNMSASPDHQQIEPSPNIVIAPEKNPKLETPDTIEDNYENSIDSDSVRNSEQFAQASDEICGRKELHLQSKESESSRKCEICGKDFLNSADLTLHKNTHSGEYTCKECGMVFRNLTFLNQHMIWHKGTTQKSHTCDICGKCFPGGGGFLARHKLKYHREKL